MLEDVVIGVVPEVESAVVLIWEEPEGTELDAGGAGAADEQQ